MIIDIQQHTPSQSEHYLFDTNIWIFLYCPIANHKNKTVKKYSSFYNKLIKNHSNLYITSLVLSEFINRYLRIDCKINDIHHTKFKTSYRSSEIFQNTFEIIKKTVKEKILKRTKCLDDEMSQMSLDQILFDSQNADFNDVYISHLAKRKEIGIVTDDKDFSKLAQGRRIFTGNNRLLSSDQ